MNVLNHIILSSDCNPKYLDFWPSVSAAWRKLFEAKVWLVRVEAGARAGYDSGHVFKLPLVEGIPAANQAKVARYWFASFLHTLKLPAGVVMTNDIDLLPLDRQHVEGILSNRPAGTLLTLGSELYTGREAGKFTAGYLTAEASVWRSLVNPQNLWWDKWVKSFCGLRHFDLKEDISSTIVSENPDCFSDESLLRYLLWKNPVPVIHKRMPFWPYTLEALDRADWKLDLDKLRAGVYKEAHLPRPLNENLSKIQPLWQFLGL